jgi:3-methyladenine DNA glycosylase AlkD
MRANIINRVIRDLKNNIDTKTKERYQRFFKEKVKAYGVKSAAVGKIAKDRFKEIKDLNKKEIFELCEELFKSGYCEESFIASNWSYKCSREFKPSDFKIFVRWVDKYIDNWAKCDTFCTSNMGEFIDMYPKYIEDLKKLTKSRNRWVKRASAVSLIVSARKGKYLKDVFEIADMLLTDSDDMVQKGYGWMLKVASNLHKKEVFNYVVKNKKQMPRTALRYAIEKMPENLRKKAMSLD